MAGIGLRAALEQAGLHAMRIRASLAPVIVELQVLPVGIEVAVEVLRFGETVRKRKRLIGWEPIEHTTRNVLVETMDALIAELSAK